MNAYLGKLYVQLMVMIIGYQIRHKGYGGDTQWQKKGY